MTHTKQSSSLAMLCVKMVLVFMCVGSVMAFAGYVAMHDINDVRHDMGRMVRDLDRALIAVANDPGSYEFHENGLSFNRHHCEFAFLMEPDWYTAFKDKMELDPSCTFIYPSITTIYTTYITPVIFH